MEANNIQELGRNAGTIIRRVVETGRPQLVTKRGQPVVAIVRIDHEKLQDWIVANAPSFAKDIPGADEALEAGETVSADALLGD
jgi:prevent-host-death family protein